MSITFTIHQRGPGLDALRRQMVELGRNEVHVGVVGPNASKRIGTLTALTLAAIHELGSPKQGIPERSFIRSTLDANRDKYTRALGQLLKKFLDGKVSAREVGETMGQMMANDIKERIKAGSITPGLKNPRKKHKPLYDTGRLVEAITYAIEDR